VLLRRPLQLTVAKFSINLLHPNFIVSVRNMGTSNFISTGFNTELDSDTSLMELACLGITISTTVMTCHVKSVADTCYKQVKCDLWCVCKTHTDILLLIVKFASQVWQSITPPLFHSTAKTHLYNTVTFIVQCVDTSAAVHCLSINMAESQSTTKVYLFCTEKSTRLYNIYKWNYIQQNYVLSIRYGFDYNVYE